MVSLVIQIGDCNGPATYQALMNYIFLPYIRWWMDVYLDDIVIYSNSVDEHITHCKTVLDILRKEKLYLSAKKLQIMEPEISLLGWVIDDDGIQMDPAKKLT